jgi:peptidyl-prolyl cis-trans isomerase A (cyclophilin A)
MRAMQERRWLVLWAVAALLAGCGEQKEEPKKPEPPKPVPSVYRVRFDTSKGPFVVEVYKEWAPEGSERFYRLVEQRFYDQARFFRVVRNFVAQFGIHADPGISSGWRQLTIGDDPVKQSNRRGYVTFATSGPNTRTTQVFINLKDNRHLDKAGFAPFGRVAEGMEVVDRLYNSYGETSPRGSGPDPDQIELRGNEYLESRFPRLDYIENARVMAGDETTPANQ